ncbi:alpha/beta hydrolase-fold protein [Hydrotalea sp.]|uniref:alpha/beta hydrolase n=5 Tax=Hydrotalea sp. TaxID=2881279 RepID=UPI0026151BA3|nr:alpha/beta hydrolase-fold protein [Hydrotalea sp.]
MRNFILTVGCILLFAANVQAQFTVKLMATSVATRQNEPIYVSGNFNNWNPKDEQYRLKPFGGSRLGIVLKDMAPGNYAFKFTRGSFDKVECLADGRDMNDRVLLVNTDIDTSLSIAGWKDDYPQKPKPYTASPQVTVMDTAFYIPQLHSTRRIWLYLPKNYYQTTQTYPVLYMQDGQNLFNEQTAFAGEWGIDECLDTLSQKLGKYCIVVGIDNSGDKRMSEYSPYTIASGKIGKDSVKGEGAAYVDFIVHTLKPYIDQHYRTQKGPYYTYIAGSSMGAVISYYAAMKYPNIFGAAGIFSPAFWLYSPQQLKPDVSANFKPVYYFYAGGKESATMIGDMDAVIKNLDTYPSHIIRRSVYPPGIHKEKYWRDEFPAFYNWLMQLY